MSANTTATLSLHGFADEIVLQQGATFLTFGGLRVDAKQLVQFAPEQAANTFLNVDAALINGAWIATSVTPLRRAGPTQAPAPVAAAAHAAARPTPAPPPSGAAQRAPAASATPSGFGRPTLVGGTPPTAPPAQAAARMPTPLPQRPAGGSPFAGLMGSRPATPATAVPRAATNARPSFNPDTLDDLNDIPF